MSGSRIAARARIILKAWPPAGAVFVILSFVVTGVWLWHAFSQNPAEMGWLEPLAAFLAGTGAFIVAAILIFRRVDSARAEADAYGLARGLATGYYFNFIRPLVTALSDPEHPIHSDIAGRVGHAPVGIVVGLPQAMNEFDQAEHEALLGRLAEGDGPRFEIGEVEVRVEGRPRPVSAKVARSDTTSAALIVDIPTTLAVIADFARFVATQELDDAPMAEDGVVEAREEIVADTQTTEFREVLDEFVDAVNRIGSMEPRERAPARLVHVVPLKNLRRRLDELADH